MQVHASAAERLASIAELNASLAGSELEVLGLSLLDCLDGAHLDLTRLPHGFGYSVPLRACEVFGRRGVS